MQVRIDHDIAEVVKKESKAHKRLFKRTKSASEIVNVMLREALIQRSKASAT